MRATPQDLAFHLLMSFAIHSSCSKKHSTWIQAGETTEHQGIYLMR